MIATVPQAAPAAADVDQRRAEQCNAAASPASGQPTRPIRHPSLCAQIPKNTSATECRAGASGRTTRRGRRCERPTRQPQLHRTQRLATETDLSALTELSGRWDDLVHGRRPPRGILLDMASSVSPTHGAQEMRVWNGNALAPLIQIKGVFAKTYNEESSIGAIKHLAGCSMSDAGTSETPPSKYDVFISYAHDDNNTIGDETRGWVEQFEKDFRTTLKEQLGRPPEIWRDSDITPNEDFERKIFNRLAKSVIFLPVLSKIFINRPYCLRELRSFVENAEKHLATYIGDTEKKRIFIVEKLAVERNLLPKELQGLGGTIPFHDSEQTWRTALFSKDSPYQRLYFEALNRLSRYAAALIQLAERGAPAERDVSALPVYLAETTSDLYDAREALRDDLNDRGFQVLPELELPREVKKYTEAVKSCLERAVLSVHVVGPEYGFIPEGEKELSNIRLQHLLALERCERAPPMAQVIWLAPGSDAAADERQRAFIDYLRNDERAHADADLIEGDIESLKTDLLEKLEKLRKAAGAEKPEAAGPQVEHPHVYIICHPADRSNEHLKALKAYLYAQGCEPRLPTEEGTADEMRKAHEQKLRDCDAFMIYAGADGEAWLEAQLDDLYKLLKDRSKNVLAKAVYIAPPKTSAKDEFETHEALVLRAGDGFEPAIVEPFLRLCGRPAADR